MSTRKTTKAAEAAETKLTFSANAMITIPVREYQQLIAKANGHSYDNDEMFFWLDKFRREADRHLLDRFFNGKSELYQRTKHLSSNEIQQWTFKALNTYPDAG